MQSTSDTDNKIPQNSILRMAAYVLMAIAGTFGLWRATTFTQEVASESRERSIAICEATNDLKSVLTELITEEGENEGSSLSVSPETLAAQTPEVQQLLSEIAQGSERSSTSFERRAERLLQLKDCDAIRD